MSGAATSAGASKFQQFMGHPAGELIPPFSDEGQPELKESQPFSLTRMHRIGPKTVFFWAPLMKWCLVIAGIKDLSRPADKLSVSQNLGEAFRRSMGVGHVECSALAALAATGFIWVRYSLVITPVNYSLAAVRLLGNVVEVV